MKKLIPNLGDITQINWSRVDPVDCVCWGSPCQNLSLAGDKEGLEGKESCLYLEGIHGIKELRKRDELQGRTGVDIRPRYSVWENVPGTLSNKKGKTFSVILQEFIKIVQPECPHIDVPCEGWHKAGCIYDEENKWSLAWRIHDSQFFGAPQRRRRLSVVCDFAGVTAPEILFERQSLLGDSETSGEGRQGTSSKTESCSGKAVGFPLGFRSENTRLYNECATTLCNGTRPGFCAGVLYEYEQEPVCIGNGQLNQISMKTVANALDCMHDQQAILTSTDVVRRFTPLECERLQGYPDGWTDIGDWIDTKGRKHKLADKPRYRALGNSLCLPFWQWLINRISDRYPSRPTMGSLFDGIGGFPLCWERRNGKGSVLWLSEIDEFAMAVTRKRFE